MQVCGQKHTPTALPGHQCEEKSVSARYGLEALEKDIGNIGRGMNER